MRKPDTLAQVTRASAPASALCLAFSLAFCLALGVSPVAGEPVAGVLPQLSVSATPGELTLGGELAVDGRLTLGEAGVPDVTLELQAAVYPHREFLTVSNVITGPDGSYAFPDVRPDRNTRLRVLYAGPPAATSQTLGVTVDPAVSTNSVSLGGGRTHLSLRLGHTLYGGSPPVSAR